LHPERLEQPLKWRRPRLVFVNSMSDLFHELVPLDFVADVYRVMQEAEQHTFQVLTKRPERAVEFYRRYARNSFAAKQRPLPNVWLGVSIENSRFTSRAAALLEAPTAVRFISAEPLLGSLFENHVSKRPLDLVGIDWLIAGGESGRNYRPVNVLWVRELRDACRDTGVAFFFKQWGGRTPKAGGRLLDGEHWDEMPSLRATA